MQAAIHLRNDEQLGLLIAVLAHVGVVGALVLQAMRPPVLIPPPERISVSLAEEVALEATAPELATEAAAATAPIVADKPRPAPSPVAKPRELVRPTPPPTPRALRTPQPQRTPPPPTRPSGGSQFGDAFKDGQGAARDENAPLPASEIGRAERASLEQSITRQLKPQWERLIPKGLDAEKLTTVVVWRLNEDGTVAGAPSCQPTQGITPSNRPQMGLHCEAAVRTIRTTRFDLPAKYYNLWKKLTWEFNKDLSQ